MSVAYSGTVYLMVANYRKRPFFEDDLGFLKKVVADERGELPVTLDLDAGVITWSGAWAQAESALEAAMTAFSRRRPNFYIVLTSEDELTFPGYRLWVYQGGQQRVSLYVSNDWETNLCVRSVLTGLESEMEGL